MAEIYSGADAIRFFRSGATVVDDPQTSALACLGGNRASTALSSLSVSPSGSIPGITVEMASGANGEGTGSLTATSTTELAFTAPDGSQGTSVAIADGETKILTDGASSAKFIRVSRSGTTDLAGTMSLVMAVNLNNVIGGPNILSAEALAGEDYYLAFFGQNKGAGTLALATAWIGGLTSAVITDSAQLSASGSGSVTTIGSFAYLPESGGARICTSDGTLREIVYYSSRTDTTLTVPAAGRALLGTTAAAGTATDTITACRLVRLASETPVSGVVQEIDDIYTEPTGLTWSTAISQAKGLNIGTLEADDEFALWLHFHIPAGTAATPDLLDNIQLSFES